MRAIRRSGQNGWAASAAKLTAMITSKRFCTDMRSTPSLRKLPHLIAVAA